MKLLEHPSLVAEAPTELTQINVQHGLAGSVLDQILHERSGSEGAKRATEKQKLERNLTAENLQYSDQNVVLAEQKVVVAAVAAVVETDLQQTDQVQTDSEAVEAVETYDVA